MRKSFLLAVLGAVCLGQALLPGRAAAEDVLAYHVGRFAYYVDSGSVISENETAYEADVKYVDTSGSGYDWTNHYTYRWIKKGKFWEVKIGLGGDRYPVEEGSREEAILKVIQSGPSAAVTKEAASVEEKEG